MITRKVSIIVFYDDKGNVLLQDRRKRSKWGEEYGIFGGKIEEGENPEQSLLREIKEELDITLEDYSLFKKYSQELRSINHVAVRNVFIAKMPDLSKVNVQEGELAIINHKDINKLKMVEGDFELVEEICNKLFKKSI